jgi:hypothetical protein
MKQKTAVGICQRTSVDTQKDIAKMVSSARLMLMFKKLRLRHAVQGDGSNQLCGCANLYGYLKVHHLAGC